MSVDAILQGQNYTITEEDTLLANKAPTNHRSPNDTYGTGNATYFGHVKLLTSHESTATVGEGIAATPLAVKQVYDAIPSAYTTTPKNLGTASAGTSTSWARGDHVHAMPSPADIGAAASGDIPSAYTATPKALGTASAGTSTSWARGDHVHKLPSAADINAATPGDIPSAYTSNPAQIASSASAGTSTLWARGDHVHKVASLAVLSGVLASDATPKTLGTATAGTFLMCSRADHVHRMPTPAEIGAATPGAIPSSFTGTPSAIGTAAAGSSTTWAKGDHVHSSWYPQYLTKTIAKNTSDTINTNNSSFALLLFVYPANNYTSATMTGLYLLSGYSNDLSTYPERKRYCATISNASDISITSTNSGWTITNNGAISIGITVVALRATTTIS